MSSQLRCPLPRPAGPPPWHPPPGLGHPPRRFDRDTATWHGRVCPTCRIETPTSGVCETGP